MSAPWRPTFVRLYAIGGAIAFAVSLVSGIRLYVALGRVPATVDGTGVGGGANDLRALSINILLFGLFALHHSLLARTGAKIVLTRWIPPAIERSTYVWLASLLFLLVTSAWQGIGGVVYAVDGPAAWLGLLAQGAGVLLTALAAKAIDAGELAGLRQAWRYGTPGAATLDALDSQPVTFTTRGAYGLVRHPIYLGWLLIVWGAPHMTWGRVAFAAISSAYLVVAIPWEERTLVERHGEAYRQYRAQVRWRMLPGVY